LSKPGSGVIFQMIGRDGMHIPLTPRLEELVREKVESSLYNNAAKWSARRFA